MDNLSIEEKYEQIIEALGAEDFENFEDVLLMARGQYFGRGEQHQTMEWTIDGLYEALKMYVESGAGPSDAYELAVKAIAKAEGKEGQNV